MDGRYQASVVQAGDGAYGAAARAYRECHQIAYHKCARRQVFPPEALQTQSSCLSVAEAY